MKKLVPYVLMCLALAMVFALIGLWIMAQWQECIGMGFSQFYCVGHVL